MMKRYFSLVGLMMCFVSLTAEASILYRGRLTQNVNEMTTFDADAKYKMTFRVYAKPQGGEALYTQVCDEVAVRTNGGFEVLLDAPELDAAIDNEERTVYVGLTLETGRELMPRRQILALPQVVLAEKADQLSPAGHIETLKAGNLAAKTISADYLTVGGTLTTRGSRDTISIQGYDASPGSEVDLRAQKVSAFGDVSVLVSGRADVAAGDELAVAPADGVAFICAVECSGIPRIPGAVLFCRRGDKIIAPATAGSDERISVRFYSFLVK